MTFGSLLLFRGGPVQKNTLYEIQRQGGGLKLKPISADLKLSSRRREVERKTRARSESCVSKRWLRAKTLPVLKIITKLEFLLKQEHKLWLRAKTLQKCFQHFDAC